MTVKEYLILEHKINKGNTKVQQVKESAPKAIKTAKKTISHGTVTKYLISVCKEYDLEYQLEVGFSEIRRWKADLAIPRLNILVESEGIMSEKSRHTSITGFSNDCEKYNNAGSKDFTILRYTILNYKQFECDLLRYFYHNNYTKTLTKKAQ